MNNIKQSIREYQKNDIISFRKTKEAYGIFSNMASGYPLEINGLNIKSSEALYQATKFSDAPDIQLKILIESNPFKSKMISRENNNKIRKDWDNIKVKIMRFCLQAKLAQHYETFGKALKESYPKTIVEYSPTDSFWGAAQKDNRLVGVNALGRLLMELRADMIENKRNVFEAAVPDIKNFKLLEREVKPIKIITN